MEGEINYSLEFIRLRLIGDEETGIEEWLQMFTSALNELNRDFCRRLLYLAKSMIFAPKNQATVVFCGALLQLSHEQWNDAINQLEKCLIIWRSISNLYGISQARLYIGQAYRLKGFYEQSKRNLLEGLKTADSLEDMNQISSYLNELGQIFELSGELEVATKLYAQSVELRNDPLGIAQSRYRLAFAYQNTGNFDAANENYRLARELLTQRGIRHVQLDTEANYQLGVIAYEQGNYVEAYNVFTKTLAILQMYSHSILFQGRILQGLGMLLKEQGQRDQALFYYEEAEKIFRELENQEGAGGILLQRGLIELDRNHSSKAAAHFDSARRLFKELNNKMGLADTYFGLGKAHHNLREYSRAFDFLYQALNFYQLTGSKVKTSRVLFELGRLTAEQGGSDAETYFQQALKISRAINCKPIVADSMFYLGSLRCREGNYPEAKDYYYPQSLTIYMQMNARPKIGQVLYEMGRLHYQLREFATAQETLQSAVDTYIEINDRTLAVEALQQLEVIALLSKEYSKAYLHFQYAQELLSSNLKGG